MKTETGKKNGNPLKKLIIIAAALAAALIFSALPLPESMRQLENAGLSAAGQAAMGVLLFALILWITEAVPFHITGLLSMILLTLMKVGGFKDIVRFGFGNDIFIFFLGVLILSAFITKSGLGKRISVYLLSKTGNSTSMIILGFLIAGTVLSMWLTNMAVAAMLMPIGRALLQEEGVEPLKSNFGKALMISICWGSIIGGIATPSGAGPNPLAIGFLKEMAGIELSFIDWMIYGVPSAVLLLFPVWGCLLLFFKPEIKHLKKSREELKAEYRAMPPFSREEKITLTIFLITILLWITSPLLSKLLRISIPISMPVLLSTAVFFFPGVSSTGWKEIEKSMSWSSILLVVTGISLGMMLYKSGAANWLAVGLLGGIGNFHPLTQVFMVVLLVSFLKIAFSSNTVTATIIIPIMIALAQNIGVPPLTITIPAALTASMAFILVTSSPTNVIPYSAGYFSIRDMAVSGIFVTVIASAIVSAVIFTVGSFTGLY